MKSSVQENIQKNRRARQRMGCALLAGLLFLFLCFFCYFLLQINSVQRSWIYPFPHQEIVFEFAHEYHVDPYLAAAVIKMESSFRPEVHSHRGAVGLMQLMPDTAEWIAEQIEDEDFSIERLHEPESNIRYGIWYLSSLEREFDGNDILVLAAYNAGRGNVSDWMEEYQWDEDFHDIGAIPYAETRAYVHRVLRYRDKYRSLYGVEQ